MLVAVLAADYSPWASVHMQGARKAGAMSNEIAEAVLCAVATMWPLGVGPGCARDGIDLDIMVARRKARYRRNAGDHF